MLKKCLYCGKEFETSRQDTKCCSSDHNYLYKLKKDRDNYISVAKYAEFICQNPDCGKTFMAVKGKSNKYCSKACQNKVHRKLYNQKRAKQMKNAFVECVYKKKLYDKSKGLCGICGRPIDLGLPNLDTWALTVDHIVPLSKGGSHSMANCQIAHRICNSYKLDSIDFHIDWDKVETQPKKDWYRLLCEQNSSPQIH